jgi:hypothetical protein
MGEFVCEQLWVCSPVVCGKDRWSRRYVSMSDFSSVVVVSDVA